MVNDVDLGLGRSPCAPPAFSAPLYRHAVLRELLVNFGMFCERQGRTQMHAHTVHLPLGAPLTRRAMCVAQARACG